MEPRPPRQLTSISPFSSRDFFTISKDFVFLFPELDIRDDDESIMDAFKRPLRGESPLTSSFIWPESEDEYSALPSYGSSWIIRDENFEDTGLQVTADGTSSLNVSPGTAVLAGMSISYPENTTIDLTDFSNYLDSGDSSGGDTVDYYLCICCSDSSGNPDIVMTEDGVNTTAFVMCPTELFSILGTMFPFSRTLFLPIAAVTTDGDNFGQILSIDYSNEVWDRELLAYPPGPPLNPSLNGGVVESGDNWVEDWT